MHDHLVYAYVAVKRHRSVGSGRQNEDAGRSTGGYPGCQIARVLADPQPGHAGLVAPTTVGQCRAGDDDIELPVTDHPAHQQSRIHVSPGGVNQHRHRTLTQTAERGAEQSRRSGNDLSRHGQPLAAGGAAIGCVAAHKRHRHRSQGFGRREGLSIGRHGPGNGADDEYACDTDGSGNTTSSIRHDTFRD